MVLLLAVLIGLLAPAASAPILGDDHDVRVRVLDRQRPASVSVRATDSPATLTADGVTLLTLAPGQTASFELRGGRVAVRASSVSTDAAVATFEPEGAFEIVVGNATHPYRGSLEARVDGSGRSASLQLINRVGMEDYVASVVPAEYPFPEIEGVKAQAILVRTYALKRRGSFGTHDVVDHVGSQVYRGIASENDLARRAARETRGEVLTYDGGLIEAVYFSTSGGHTTDNETVWDGQPIPYLRGRPDPYDHASPLHRWRETVDRNQLHAALSRHYGVRVTGIDVASRTREGRAATIRLQGANRVEQGNRFRLAANQAIGRNLFKSTFFTMSVQGNQYVFEGRGFGHGVGMSQYGARQKALEGAAYRDILAFYYPGTRLDDIARLGMPGDIPIASNDSPLYIDPFPAPGSEAAQAVERSIPRPVTVEESETADAPRIPYLPPRSIPEPARLEPRPPAGAGPDGGRRSGW